MKDEVKEYKDAEGKNRLRVNSKGNRTYASTQGYNNRQDMIDAAVHSSMEILKKYVNEIPDEKYNEFITDMVANIKIDPANDNLEGFNSSEDLEGFLNDEQNPDQ